MAWSITDITDIASTASQTIASAASVYTDLLKAQTGAAIQRTQLEAQIAEARARIAAAQGGGAPLSLPGGTSAQKTNWLMIGGFALLGGLLLWKLAK